MIKDTNKSVSDNTFNKMIMLKCPECGQASPAGSWDSTTTSIFSNRESRRRYMSITKKASRNKGSKRVYICPLCNSTVDGYRIKDI